MKIKTYFILVTLFFFQVFTYPQHNEVLRIVTYNILNYPDSYTQRDGSFQLVLDDINPDIIVVQEITSHFGVNNFLTNVLGNKYTAGPFINGPDTDNEIFYKDSLVTLISHIAIPTSLRNISEFKLYDNFALDTLYIFSVHLKAGQSDTTRRKNEVTILRNVTDNLPAGSNFMVVGDFNIYRSSEPAYQKLINQDNPGYFIDPQYPGNWHNNIAYASMHTQSTMTVSHWGGSTGGLDDRFDMILISQAISDTSGVTIIENSYTPFGNDGNHFNKAINDPPFNIITQEVADALNNASDHLPVYADFDFGIVSGFEEINYSANDFALYQNYPNPFNPGTKIKFTIPDLRFTILKVYDVLGNEIATLVNKELSAGTYEVQFDASKLPSGIYMYRLTVGSHSLSKKMILLK